MTPYRESAPIPRTEIRVPPTRSTLAWYFGGLAFVAIGGLVAVLLTAGSTEVRCDRALGPPRCTAIDHRLYARSIRETISAPDVVAEDIGGGDTVRWSFRFGHTRFDQGCDEAFAKRVEARTKAFFADEKAPAFQESRVSRGGFVSAGVAVLMVWALLFFGRNGALVIGDRANDRVGVARLRMLGHSRPRWYARATFDEAVANSDGTDGSVVLLVKDGTDGKIVFSGGDEECAGLARAINAAARSG